MKHIKFLLIVSILSLKASDINSFDTMHLTANGISQFGERSVVVSKTVNQLREDNSVIPVAVKKIAIIIGSTTLGTVIGFCVGNCVPFMPVMKYDADGTPDWTPAVIKVLGSALCGAILGLISGTKTANSMYNAP